MSIQKLKIIHFSQFSAPFKGGFIGSLEALKKHAGQECDFVFCFPKSVKKNAWFADFQKKNKVYFTEDDVKKSSNEIFEIFKIENPDFVHSHFDGYDLPILKAKSRYSKHKRREIKIIWHIRNHILFHQDPLKKLYQRILFKYKFGLKAKKVNIISVSQEMMNFVDKRRGNNSNQNMVLPNGIIAPNIYKNDKGSEFTFGAFGGRNVSKRIDTLLHASTLLINQGMVFQVILTKGVDTLEVVNDFFNNKVPQWLILEEQTNEIGRFFARLDCLVSCSVHETFSNAIAEASILGIPVIQSDIEGTLWNAQNPSTILFKTLDSNDLASKMKELMNANQEELEEKCKITAINNRSRFGIDAWCDKMLDFYRSIH